MAQPSSQKSSRGGSGVGSASALAQAAASLRARALLRRLAVLRWMVPCLTARSSSELSSRAWAVATVLSLASKAVADFLESVLRVCRVLRLRAVRTLVCRARLAADLMLAMMCDVRLVVVPEGRIELPTKGL